MNPILIGISFLASALLVVGVYLAIHDVLARRRKQPDEAIGRANLLPADLAFATADKNARRPTAESWHERFRLWIDQSGVRVTPTALLASSGSLGIVSAAVVGLLVPPWWTAAFAMIVTAGIPFALLALVRHQRADRLRAQLPDALDLMSRMLRAGQTIPQALRGVAEEFDSPIADEFGYCYEQQNLGLSTDASMYEMARRTGTLELRILVVALTVHRQSGGNLSELLDNLAKVIRDRYRIQGQIRSLTADGRMQAAILLALPPLLLAVLSVLNQEYVTILYQFPWLLLGMFGFELLGAIWLHRIVSFDF